MARKAIATASAEVRAADYNASNKTDVEIEA
eukprot:CAMPEP_0116144184 /NCGR_PEP_ID=MMETSP0329-20121206/15861_1 /TAXON_ID=697910 /ORGANISM="Pseudo-nitzschia arenysensis, Strain B593" /LENGTH=30 /DNA_ID= /DNA_START= /DNA_END= /DNA_ORIENTATION=